MEQFQGQAGMPVLPLQAAFLIGGPSAVSLGLSIPAHSMAARITGAWFHMVPAISATRNTGAPD